MYRAIGSGSVVSSLWRRETPQDSNYYDFNLFQMPSATGRTSHLFQPTDLISLIKVCHELATVLIEAPAVDPSLRDELETLAARLDVVFRLET
jgi:hypothetical protein